MTARRAVECPRRLATRWARAAAGIAVLAVMASACSHGRSAAAQRFLESGNRRATQGDDKGAALEYRNAIRESPGLVEAHARLAETSARLHDVATATAALIRLGELQPRDLAAQLRAGQAALAVGRLDEARAAYTAALAIDPSSAAANRGLASAYMAGGRAHDAEPYWKAVAASADGDPFALSDYYISQRRLAEAEHELRERLGIARDAAAARLRLAAVLFDLKRSREADTLLDAALRQDDRTTAAAWMLRGRMRAAEQRLADAETAYANALRVDPTSIEALTALTSLDLASHHAADARARLERRLAREPRSTPALMLAAQLYLATGDDERGERTLQRVVEIAPESLDAYGLLGQLYIRQGRLDGARQKFEAIAGRAADPVPAATMVAMILEAEKHHDEAQRRYEAILAKDSAAGVAANNLAWIYLQQGRLPEALRLAVVAKESLRQLPQASDTLGWVYYRNGKVRDALPLLADCVDRQPNNPLYRYHLGMAYLESGMAEQATEQLTAALASPVAFDGRADAEQRMALLKTGDR